MVYRNFYIQVIVRVLLIVVNSFWLVTVLPMPQKVYTIIVASSLLVAQVAYLLFFLNRINREVGRFFASLKDEDSSFRIPEDTKDSYGQLKVLLNQTGELIRNARVEKEKQFQYLKFILKNISIGLLLCDENGKVEMINEAFQELFFVKDIKSVNEIGDDKVNIDLLAKIMKPGDHRIVKTPMEKGYMQILVKAHRFKLEDKKLRMLTFQDVKNELAENELESWQKLIRVLNHEIMNSITPINTLTLAIRKCLSDDDTPKPIDELEHELIKDAIKNTKLIEERSNGLIQFVENYRSLTRIDSINLTKFSILSLFEDIRILFQHDLTNSNINMDYQVSPDNLEIEADRNLLEQVLINLVKNSIQALDGAPEQRIKIQASLNHNERCIISVSDNGVGIKAEQLDDIFVPFYTTKSEGSGIGLSLARQIIRLHGGNISVQSVENKGATFSLVF